VEPVVSITNVELARRRRRLALALSLAGFAALVGGLFVGGGGSRWLAVAYGSLIVGSVLSWTGIALLDRWVAVPRPDAALAEALGGRPSSGGRSGHVGGSVGAGKGSSVAAGSRRRVGGAAAARWVVYNWCLPADHVIVAPWGLAVVSPINHTGPVEVDGKRWRDRRKPLIRLLSIGRRPLRDPSRLLEYEVRALRRAIDDAVLQSTGADGHAAGSAAPSVEGDSSAGGRPRGGPARRSADIDPESLPIEPIAVFTRSDVKLKVSSPSLPVLATDGLEGWLRAGSGNEVLTPVARKRLVELLDEMAAGKMTTRGSVTAQDG